MIFFTARGAPWNQLTERIQPNEFMEKAGAHESFGFSEWINRLKAIGKKAMPLAELITPVNDKSILHHICKRETVSCR
jgi:hypothetical protein